MSNKLTAHEVHVWYGSFHALKNISLTIKPNTVTAFIGPSGCGKSTFLRLFNRMNDYIDGFHMGGEITIDGRNIYGKRVMVEELRKEVGMVFQKPNPFPKSIYDNVVYGLRIQGINDLKLSATERRHRVNEMLDRMKMGHRAGHFPQQLSGGQQQRLCIARTLAVKPTMILMDEPASALDPISTAKIEELILQLKDDYTIAIVTHNMQQAARISDKTAFFYLGELIEYDKTVNIFTNPKEEKTQSYITGRFG